MTATVQADRLLTVFLRGLPSQYAGSLPDSLAGVRVNATNSNGSPFGLIERNVFHVATAAQRLRLGVRRPTVVQGDRMDIVVNGAPVVTGLLLSTEDLSFDLPLVPGANYVAVRLSQDADNDGTTAYVQLYRGMSDTVVSALGFPYREFWSAKNVLSEC